MISTRLAGIFFLLTPKKSLLRHCLSGVPFGFKLKLFALLTWGGDGMK
jgi:hypothetical protein